MRISEKYILGVDAGGTNTDAVLRCVASGSVLGTAKQPTLHHDLGQSIQNVVHALQSTHAELNPAQIGAVCVSTTLATNAIVEEKGADVGLFVIGYNQRMKLPAAVARYIPGGHTIKGEEMEPLGLEYLLDALHELHGQVDSWAVCGHMAFVNPAHELVAARAISLAGKTPVFCSHEASMNAGMKERAATAVLNAQLLPVMEKFLNGVRIALAAEGISCPVLIVRGDAQALNMEDALRHAASTVASGPAATSLYGISQSGLSDALIVDVGGTTTDITLVRRGNPVIQPGGMVIGQWDTHVEAVEMFTVGIGGDSHAYLDHNNILSVGPRRVTPLCMAKDVPLPSTWLGPGLQSRCVIASPAAQKGTTSDKDDDNRVLKHILKYGPSTPGQIKKALGMGEVPLEQRLERLERLGLLNCVGFTPTDALHTTDKLSLGDGTLSKDAAKSLASCHGQNIEEWCASVLDFTERAIFEAVLHHVSKREIGGALSAFMARHDPDALVSVDVTLNVPMVGIGAAAKYVLPSVARRLKTTIVFPEHHEVGNALGATLMAGHVLEFTENE